MTDSGILVDQTALGLNNVEMSRYIDLEIYHAVERSHPFYAEMIAEIVEEIGRGAADSPGLSLLEFGAGTGLATEEFVRNDGLRVVAVDLDRECCAILRSHIGPKAESVCDDVVRFCREGAFDLAVSVFAHDHIRHDRAPALVRNLRRNLKPGGRYIMGGELLPFYESAEERREALYTYHGFIVDKALREEHFELAQIEIGALKSGVRMIGDFKRHEAMFEREMTEDGLFRAVKKMKMGPLDRDDVGGVFVYVFEAV